MADFYDFSWNRVSNRRSLGLRWEDIDYEKRIISINHNLTYYPVGEDRASENHISTPKTEAGMRTIPMLDTVKDAFEMIWEEQKENGWTDAEIDGMTGFVFCNRYGNIMNAQSVNRAIKRISSAYNATEEIRGKKEASGTGCCCWIFESHSLRQHILHKALWKRNEPENNPVDHGA